MAVLTFATYWAFVGLALTTVVSTALFVLDVAKWRGTEGFARWVNNNRALVAVLVQIISHVFGMIQVQALCTVVKLSFRVHVVQSSISFDFARFISAISIPRAVWNGKGSLILVSVLVFATSLVPGAVWSGAITPEITEHTVRRTIQTADFAGLNESDPWEGTSALGPSPWLTEQGLFSFDPDDITDLLISSAREASVQRLFNGTQNYTFHSKLDSSGFSYIGRSFGAGSSAGLVNVSDVYEPLWYQYGEGCMVSNVTCSKNASSNFTFYDQNFKPTGVFVGEGGANFISVASGTFPNGTAATDQWHNGAVAHDLFAMAGEYGSQAGSVMMTTGALNDPDDDPWNFAQFNDSQCGIEFQFSWCTVMVNVTEMSIHVYNEGPLAWLSWGDAVAGQAVHAIVMLSTVDNAFGGSRLGRSLVTNSRYLRNLIQGNFSAANIPDDIIFASEAQYVASILDNELVALNAAQLVARNASKAFSALVGMNAVQYGSPPYIYAIFILNWLVLLICAVQAMRTKLWIQASSLDFTDISQLILSASKGGDHLYHIYQANGARDTDSVRFALEEASPNNIPALIHAASLGRYTKLRKTEALDPHVQGLELQDHSRQHSVSSQTHPNHNFADSSEVELINQSSTTGYDTGHQVHFRPSW